MRFRVLFFVVVLLLLLSSCNMPSGQVPVTGPSEAVPVSSDPNAQATAVELTAIARVTEIAATTVPQLTATPAVTSTSAQCNPTVTASVNANIRSGPDTAYGVVGSLNLGQTAAIVGRNDAYTWWYISHPGIAGGHGWIAGSVVTSACVPSIVQVVAAPLLPTAPPATHVPATEAAGDGGGPLILIPPLTLLFPDLSVSMEVPASAFLGGNVDVKVKVKNVGDIVASNFTVQWWAGAQLGCSWPVDTLAAGATKNLNCSYAFPNIGDFTVKTIVDSGATVLESNESNNMSQANLQVNQLILFLTPFFP